MAIKSKINYNNSNVLGTNIFSKEEISAPIDNIPVQSVISYLETTNITPRDYYKGTSFRYSGEWLTGTHYLNDQYFIDFVVINNVLLRCKKSHLSSLESKPVRFIYDDKGNIVGIDSEYWDFVLAGFNVGEGSNFQRYYEGNTSEVTNPGEGDICTVPGSNTSYIYYKGEWHPWLYISLDNIANWNNKADKVQSAVEGHIATLDSSGNLVDSGKGISDINPLWGNIQGSIENQTDLISALSDKQDTIADLSNIRAGAAAGATAYQKPSTGIPAADIASGVIPDVSNFITKSVNDLVNYYTKSETYTKGEVNGLIGAINQFHYEIYPSTNAVQDPQSNVLYLIGPTGSGSDRYEEYVFTIDWVKIGDTSIDVSGFVTTSDLDTELSAYTTSAELESLLGDYVTESALEDLLAEKQSFGSGAAFPENPKEGDIFVILAHDEEIELTTGVAEQKVDVPHLALRWVVDNTVLFDLGSIKTKNTITNRYVYTYIPDYPETYTGVVTCNINDFTVIVEDVNYLQYLSLYAVVPDLAYEYKNGAWVEREDMSDVLRYSAQDLTPAQQKQVRKNITAFPGMIFNNTVVAPGVSLAYYVRTTYVESGIYALRFDGKLSDEDTETGQYKVVVINSGMYDEPQIANDTMPLVMVAETGSENFDLYRIYQYVVAPNYKYRLEKFYIKPATGIPASDLADGVIPDISGKADAATTLAGYGITDAYTKTEVDSKVASTYKPAGSVANVGSLGSLTAANLGKVYNFTASFTTTSDFVEGSGKTYPVGTNVVIVDVGTAENPSYKYDVLAGFVDLSSLQNYSTGTSFPENPKEGDVFVLTQNITENINSSWETIETNEHYRHSVPAWAQIFETRVADYSGSPETYELGTWIVRFSNNNTFVTDEIEITEKLEDGTTQDFIIPSEANYVHIFGDEETSIYNVVGAFSYNLKAFAGTYQYTNSSWVKCITEAERTAWNANLGKADTAYQKPSGGIPKADLVQAVQDSLGKADGALQGVINDEYDFDADTGKSLARYVATKYTSEGVYYCWFYGHKISDDDEPSEEEFDTAVYTFVFGNGISVSGLQRPLVLVQDIESPFAFRAYYLQKTGSGNNTKYSLIRYADEDWVNTQGFLKSFTETDPTVPSWAKQPNKPSYSYSEISNTPSLATVATSGSYNDLSNIPPAVTVDQIYDGTSSNPQSGIAIEGELENFVEIDDYSDTFPIIVNPSNYYTKTETEAIVETPIESTQPSNGFLPNVIYDLGEITNNVAFTIAVPTNNNIANTYVWTFDTGSTAPTITWPSNIIWFGGSAPAINTGKHYEITVRKGYANCLEF